MDFYLWEAESLSFEQPVVTDTFRFAGLADSTFGLGSSRFHVVFNNRIAEDL